MNRLVMHGIYRILVLVFVAGLLAPLEAKETPWRKLQSEHFVIFTQDTEQNARKVLEHLERVRVAYQVLTNSKVEHPGRGRVVLFRNKADYAPYAMLGFSDAYYLHARSQDYIVLNSFDESADRVLNHEYFHLFSRHADFNLPVWLEEGLADFYSTLKISSKEISTGLPVKGHLQFLNSFVGSPAPLSEIFAITKGERHHTDYRATLQLYAQGWALTHMTFLGKQMMTRADEFFQGVRSGGNAEQVYQRVYGLSLRDLDKLLADYIRRSSYQYFKKAAPNLDATAPVQEVVIQAWEAPLLLANLQQYTQRPEMAHLAYQELALRFPEVPEIAEAQGYLALMNMDRGAAAEHFRQAAAKGSSTPSLYYDLVVVSCDYQTFDEQCQRWVNEALRLNPANLQARKWAIGYVLNARKFERALAYMARWGNLKSEDAPEFFFSYAYAQANLGRMEDARAAVKRGLQFATKPVDIARLQRMEKLVESSAEYREQMAQLPSPLVKEEARDVVAPPFAADRPEQPRLRRGMPPVRQHGPPGRTSDGTPSSVMEQFILGDGNLIVAGIVKSIECGESPALVMEATGRNLRIVIDDPRLVRVFRGGEEVGDHPFACGTIEATRSVVGYHASDAPLGANGVLRILSFD